MLLLIRGVLRHRKNLVKKRTETHFSVFIENRNWDLKFVFWFDNENKKPKTIKILFHFKTKIECPLQPTDYHRYFPNRSNSKRKRKKKRLKNILKLRKHCLLLLNYIICYQSFLTNLTLVSLKKPKNCLLWGLHSRYEKNFWKNGGFFGGTLYTEGLIFGHVPFTG